MRSCPYRRLPLRVTVSAVYTMKNNQHLTIDSLWKDEPDAPTENGQSVKSSGTKRVAVRVNVGSSADLALAWILTREATWARSPGHRLVLARPVMSNARRYFLDAHHYQPRIARPSSDSTEGVVYTVKCAWSSVFCPLVEIVVCS